MKSKQYNITVNDEQLRVILSSLEVLSRLYSGQWEMIFDHAFRYNSKYKSIYKKMDEYKSSKAFEKIYKDNITNKGMFYNLIYILKKHLLDLSSNEGLGVGSKEADNDMNTAFDMIQVFRHHRGDSRQPMQFDKKNKLAKIESKEVHKFVSKSIQRRLAIQKGDKK